MEDSGRFNCAAPWEIFEEVLEGFGKVFEGVSKASEDAGRRSAVDLPKPSRSWCRATARSDEELGSVVWVPG